MIVKYLFCSDWHSPFYNKRLLDPFIELIKDLKPDYLELVGDVVDFYSVSKFDQDPKRQLTLEKEKEETNFLLDMLTMAARGANPNVIIEWDEGNHEARLEKYVISTAPKTRGLTVNGEEVLSIPHIFELKKRNIKWYSSMDDHLIGKFVVEHGSLVKKRSGMTANGMMDLRNSSGISGHTHRLSYVQHSTMGSKDFWIELGCMCDLKPTYMKNPDWQNGCCVGLYDTDKRQMFPVLIPIYNNHFIYNGKMY